MWVGENVSHRPTCEAQRNATQPVHAIPALTPSLPGHPLRSKKDRTQRRHQAHSRHHTFPVTASHCPRGPSFIDLAHAFVFPQGPKGVLPDPPDGTEPSKQGQPDPHMQAPAHVIGAILTTAPRTQQK
jgi:hypothetical protein